MKRTDIKELLPDINGDTLDKLMELHGNTVNKAKADYEKTTVDLQTQLTALTDERDTLLNTVSENDKHLYNTIREYNIKDKLNTYNTQDRDLLYSLIDLESVTDDLDGLDQQINSIKEAKPFLFVADTVEEKPTPQIVTEEAPEVTKPTNPFQDIIAGIK